MEDCIFCKIASGEIPCQRIWEDENYLAFLDIKPEIEGHTLIIPKKHFQRVWDVEDYGGYFEKAREVAKILLEKHHAGYVEMKIVGEKVLHAHIHLIPR